MIWEFFNKSEDGNRVSCKLFSRSYKYIGNTTNCVNHLKKKHIIQYSEASGAVLQINENRIPSISIPPTSDNVLMPSQSSDNREFTSTESTSTAKRARQNMRITTLSKVNIKKADEAVLDMIVLDMQPLQIVENEGFKKFTKILNADYELPSKKKMFNV